MICDYCFEDFAAATTGRPPRFCSDRCRQAAHYESTKVLSFNPAGPYSVLVADPPWKLNDQPPKGGAEQHYPLMTTPEICAFELPLLTPNAWLFLWKLASMPQDALDVCRAWGFRPVQEIVWTKTTKTGAPRIGPGWYARPAHETCILAVRGPRPTTVRRNAATPSWFKARRGRHSEKPELFYRTV